ncbi:hypothetical protein HOLleu_26028 [Holothuria leucospilota]|uniref:Uncharacterized protein n=1 Tax=Holothuria leucospilota TaxID=206669 RepID=A0A9Q1H280_HOLLE|nr:hypothetical protein HOLleu_26028 [Holothuria leucospilota]
MTDPSTSTNTGQLFIALGAIQDYTLKEELSCEMKKNIAVTHRFFLVAIPFTSGTKHGILVTIVLSDSPKQVLNPYLTNYQTVKQIDRIEDTNDGTVFMYKGDDVMTLNIQYDKECQRVESTPLRNDFVQLTTNNHVTTNYPKPFDWGCESLGLNVSFCETLQQNRCGLERAGSDICATKFMTLYQPCPATFSIMNMTGFFQNEVLPFVSASELPLVSFEAEWLNSTQSAGLVFPCFTD